MGFLRFVFTGLLAKDSAGSRAANRSRCGGGAGRGL